MKKNNIYRIIKEEIEEFDFLNINKVNEEELNNQLLNSKEFQTNLVNDIITNFDNQSKFREINVMYQQNNVDDLEIDEGGNTPLNLTYDLDITYVFNGKPIKLSVLLEGNNVRYEAEEFFDTGSYDTPPSTDFEFKKIDWDDIDLKIFTEDGDEINFDWLYKNTKLYGNVVRSLIKPFFQY